jgi:hypothetical protein
VNARDYSHLIAPSAYDDRPCCANPECGEVFVAEAANDTTCPRCTGLCSACWSDGCECHGCGLQCSSNCACALPDDDGDAHHVGVRGRA